MQKIIGLMQDTLEVAGGNAGYTALFLAGIVALWHGKFQNKTGCGYLFWYAIVLLLLTISPLRVFMIQNYFPEMLWNECFLWILPVAPVIMFLGVASYEKVTIVREKVLLVIGMVALLLLAGAGSYGGKGIALAENSAYIPAQEHEILSRLEYYMDTQEKETVYLWADATVMEYAAIMPERILMPYGKDLWLGIIDTQMHQIYNEWHYTLYEQMQNAAYYETEIVNSALAMGCDVLILAKESYTAAGAEMPVQLGETYYLYGESADYVMYVCGEKLQ